MPPQSHSKTLQAKVERDGEEEIQEPTGIPFTLAGKEYNILPMPDYKLIKAMAHMTLLANIASDFIDQARVQGGVGQLDIMLKLPDIIIGCIPVATKLIAIELDLDEDFVSANCPLAKKMEALHCIFKAEDVGLLIKNLTGIRVLLETPVVLKADSTPVTP